MRITTLFFFKVKITKGMATWLPDRTFKRKTSFVVWIVFRQTPSLGFHTLSELSLDPLIK